ncbi:MAG TPA: DinB family protein [Terriglobales bacterium]|nr:DinB family protein [Terriglobales bacterium]
MTTTLAPMLEEFQEEAAVTRRVLNRVPADKLAWKPHAKSMSLGQLAIHVATVPGALARITQQDAFDVSQGSFEPPHPKNLEEIHAAFEQSVHAVEEHLKKMTDQEARKNWRLMLHDKELFCKPRVNVMRSIMLNHWYHHRGQLSVYLRLLDVPVPVIYGRSADENPFT